ncbi:hypothetical protein Clacol_001921 [Clathrus columnatus]|uniref:Uncharacterized protein n=1 Tax=Clathrus columnatus TaxID=1419009 RepID=A0AAV5A538_9AGAM|nr:hypothetical protein Clacol_001921 [Clathrus columnatus]
MFSLKSKHKATATTIDSAPLIQLREINSDSHSHPELSDAPPIFADDLDVKRPLEDYGDEDNDNDSRTDSSRGGERESFGKDTAIKASAFASDDIYIEDMWGELVKAEPGQVSQDQIIRPCYIPRIPDQSIPDNLPGPSMSIPALPVSAAEVSAKLGSFFKKATEKFLDNVAQMQGTPRRRNPVR